MGVKTNQSSFYAEIEVDITNTELKTERHVIGRHEQHEPHLGVSER
jgi:hypothetical protein